MHLLSAPLRSMLILPPLFLFFSSSFQCHCHDVTPIATTAPQLTHVALLLLGRVSGESTIVTRSSLKARAGKLLIKSQIVNTLGSAGPKIYAAVTQLCHCATKAAATNTNRSVSETLHSLE